MPFMPWAIHMLQWMEQQGNAQQWPPMTIKSIHNSAWRLQSACMKLESQVIAGQPYSGEVEPGPCTHRPSHSNNPSHFEYSNPNKKDKTYRVR